MMEYIFESRFNWMDAVLMLSAPPLVNIIGWWVLPAMLVGFILSAVVASKLGVM